MRHELGADDPGWVALHPTPWWMPILGTNLVSTTLFPALLAFQLGTLFDVPPVWWLPLTIGTAAFFLAATVLAAQMLHPRGYLNPASSTLRAGRAKIPYAEIIEARLIPSASKKRRALLLVLRTEQKRRATVLLRDAQQQTLEPGVAALVQDMLQRSNITMPVSPDDPKGRFARFNFPTNITKEEALELVAHPPTPADELPISQI
jgi:hypothetical protein